MESKQLNKNSGGGSQKGKPKAPTQKQQISDVSTLVKDRSVELTPKLKPRSNSEVSASLTGRSVEVIPKVKSRSKSEVAASLTNRSVEVPPKVKPRSISEVAASLTNRSVEVTPKLKPRPKSAVAVTPQDSRVEVTHVPKVKRPKSEAPANAAPQIEKSPATEILSRAESVRATQRARATPRASSSTSSTPPGGVLKATLKSLNAVAQAKADTAIDWAAVDARRKTLRDPSSRPQRTWLDEFVINPDIVEDYDDEELGTEDESESASDSEENREMEDFIDDDDENDEY